MEQGVDNTVLKRHLAYFHRQGRSQDAALLQCIAASGIWTQTRKYFAGLVESAMCPLCGLKPEDEFHMLCECAAIQQVQDSIVRRTNICGRYTYDGYSHEAVDLMKTAQCFYHRGLVPACWTVPGTPITPFSHIVGSVIPDQGEFYLDGSGGANSEDQRLRRCGWSWVAFNEQHEECIAEYGSLPYQ